MKMGANLNRPIAVIRHFDLDRIAVDIGLDRLSAQKVLTWNHTPASIDGLT
jgi:hypothetical protein